MDKISDTSSTRENKGPLLEKVRQFLFGDDIFISYSRADSTYALALAGELTGRGTSCFIDQWGTPPGEELPRELLKTMSRCSAMVLVGTSHAAASDNVGLEVVAFLKTGRPIIPITFVADELVENPTEGFNKQDLAGTLEAATWYPSINGIAKTVEVLSALKRRVASKNVVDRIVNASEFRSRSTRLRRIFFATLAGVGALVIASLAIVAVLFAQVQSANDSLATAKKNEAAAIEGRQTAEADTKIKQQELSKANGDLADTRGKLDAAATDLRDAQTKVGETEKKLSSANEDLGLARTEAREQTELAEAKRAEAEAQAERSRHLKYAADLQLARRSYSPGQFGAFESILEEAEPKLRGFEWGYLKHLGAGVIPLQSDGREQIARVRFSPSGDQFVTRDQDGSVSAWSIATAQRVKLAEDDLEDDVQLPDWGFSSDGATFAFITSENEVKVFSTSGGTWEEMRLTAPTDLAEGERYVYVGPSSAPGEIQVVSRAGSEYRVRRWSAVAKGFEAVRNVRQLGEDFEVQQIAASGNLVVTYKAAEMVMNVSLLDAEMREKLIDRQVSESDYEYSFAPTNDFVRFEMLSGLSYHNVSARRPFSHVLDEEAGVEWKAFAISADGERVAALGQEEIRIWNAHKNKLIRTLPVPYGIAKSVAFSPDGKWLGVGGHDEEDFEGNLLGVWNVPIEGDVFDFADGNPLAVSPDGTGVLTDRNSKLSLWNPATGKASSPFGDLNTASSVAAFSPDGKYLFAVVKQDQSEKADSVAGVWNTEENGRVDLPSACTNPKKLAFTSNSEGLLILCPQREAQLWDLRSGALTASFTTENDIAESSDDRPITAIASSNFVAILDGQNELLYWWDVKTKAKRSVSFCSEAIVDMSGDGRWVVTKDTEFDRMRLRRSNDMRCETEPISDEMHGVQFKHVFSSDSRFIATYEHMKSGSQDTGEEITIWDLRGDEPVRMHREWIDWGSRYRAGDLQFSPSNRFLVSGNHYWDLKSKEKKVLVGRCVIGPTFSKSEDRIITTCDQVGEVKVWSVASGQELMSFRAHDDRVQTAVLLPDNRNLVTTSFFEAAVWKTDASYWTAKR